MPTKAAKEVLQIYFNFTSQTLGLQPVIIKYNQDSGVEVTRKYINRKVRSLWCLLLIVTLLITTLELNHNLFNTNSKNLVVLFFHSYLFLSKFGTLICICAINLKSEAFVHFLNNLCRKFSGVSLSLFLNSTRKRLKNKPNNNLFLILSILCTVTTSLFYVPFTALVSLTIPCLHDNTIGKAIYGQNCSVLSFRISAFFVQIVLLLPCSLTCVLVCSVCLVTLFELHASLNTFWSLIFFLDISEFNSETFQNIGKIYHQVQVLILLSNKCFQNYIWPPINFIAGLGVIGLMYTIMISNGKIPISGISLMFVMMISTGFVCCLTLDMGSKPMLLSQKILTKTRMFGNCKWSRRFLRSCPKVSLRLGIFHVMDRERVPAFVRFILQRTFALVLKTKLSTGFGTTITVHVPINPHISNA